MDNSKANMCFPAQSQPSDLITLKNIYRILIQTLYFAPCLSYFKVAVTIVKPGIINK